MHVILQDTDLTKIFEDWVKECLKNSLKCLLLYAIAIFIAIVTGFKDMQRFLFLNSLLRITDRGVTKSPRPRSLHFLVVMMPFVIMLS